MSKKEPKIVKDIVEFFQYWQNPDRVEGEHLPIKEFQLQIYSVSIEFVFKWFVQESELKEVSEFTGIEIENNKLLLSLGEYEIELAVRPPDGLGLADGQV